MTSGGALGDADGPGRADADLLRAHVEGDPHAFNELVRRHRDRLWAVALRTIGDREEAADAVQDALLSAHRAAARFRGDSAVTTWLHRIVVNACLDRIRRRQAHPTVPLPDGTHTDDGGVGTRAEPAAPTQDHDTALVVRAALAALPPEQRAALVLVDVQGYPVAEAAEILGVAEGTIKSRCARGRARMALSLGHLRTGDDGPTVAGTGDGSGTARTADDSRSAGKRSLTGRRAASGGGDGGHGGNPGGPGHVPSGSGGSVPLPAAGPIRASGDRKDQR
ncbi:RNA polymerase sigma factor SigM [Actinoplanes sp. NPDC049316]|uniref:RNA polymerase sigma factor SigM n=1 Tax=Actinoplanes sp. NPDC049316 TaxID=3154727 RepID=UPI00344773AF